MRLVDIEISSPLSVTTIPGQNVDCKILVERLRDILYLPQPAGTPSKGRLHLFKVDTDRRGASQVFVQLGRSSIKTVEIVAGLSPGDLVIVSDTSSFEGYKRVAFR
jgi:HlyD family secretion protein